MFSNVILKKKKGISHFYTYFALSNTNEPAIHIHVYWTTYNNDEDKVYPYYHLARVMPSV